MFTITSATIDATGLVLTVVFSQSANVINGTGLSIVNKTLTLTGGSGTSTVTFSISSVIHKAALVMLHVLDTNTITAILGGEQLPSGFYSVTNDSQV